MRHRPVKMACCGVIFTAGSPRTPDSGFVVARTGNYVANPVRTLYHHREFFATGDDFDEDGVEQNRRGRMEEMRRRVVRTDFFGVLR